MFFKRFSFFVGGVEYYNSSPYIKVYRITNCLRVIRNTLHFYFAVAYVIRALCGSFCIALLTP
ncbi:hypothetical protein BS623_23245 [Vibrio parahaemolyticus]|nr:hypothetical protein BS623_23245 [Vibrio parahaemolyticus]